MPAEPTPAARPVAAARRDAPANRIAAARRDAPANRIDAALAEALGKPVPPPAA
ncbi:hypothetical protein ACFY8W_01750 [Streptomyces sp. NPDC012637]|uniref:hypothetical protein n=1 Tax=Streptomyces sp. NPDC012637 TaxID=3364842 RepID=UPI0036E77B41